MGEIPKILQVDEVLRYTERFSSPHPLRHPATGQILQLLNVEWRPTQGRHFVGWAILLAIYYFPVNLRYFWVMVDFPNGLILKGGAICSRAVLLVVGKSLR